MMAIRSRSRTDEVEHSQTRHQDPGTSLQALNSTMAFSHYEPDKPADVDCGIKFGQQMKLEPSMEDPEAGAVVKPCPIGGLKKSSS